MGLTDHERARRKRADLPRARINTTIHNVRPRPSKKDYSSGLTYVDAYDPYNTTWCGIVFRHATLPASYQTNCLECMSMDDVDFLKFEIEALKTDHQNVCETVAQMHAAAVGEMTGPRRGVVEDVLDLRLERDALVSERDELKRQLEAEKRRRRDDELAHLVEVDRLKRAGQYR